MKIKKIVNIKVSDDIRVEEVMSDRPRKFSGTENPNVYIGTYQSLEKWPKEFFKQFHTVVVDESHMAKAKTITTILEATFKHAYNRFGVSGTFPTDDTCEILNIQSVLGPKITEVSADELKKKGIITPMEIKSIIMNHNKPEIAERLKLVRKSGDGKAAFDFEKRFIHQSGERLDFIKKIVGKFTNNSLLLFNTIENGQKIFNELKDLFPDKDFYYIDGTISGKKREAIKKEMGDTKVDVEYTILNFGDYEIEFKSDFKVLLSNDTYKLARDIDSNDDISDKFIEKYKNKQKFYSGVRDYIRKVFKKKKILYNIIESIKE